MKRNKDEALLSLEAGAGALYDLAERLRKGPELGFFEFETSKILEHELEGTGARVQSGIARTGIWAELGQAGAPAVVLLADMDALPTQGVQGGVAHSCGHHAQMAVMVSVFKALAEAGTLEKTGLRLVFAASPAEEYVDLERRLLLRESGEIVYLSGKQEMIRLGFFGGNSLVLKYHSMADSPGRAATVNGTLNGFMAKRAEFTGRAAHAGASPEKGINALSAASLALQAIHAQRDTFRDTDHIRVHPILTEGGTVVNSVPARAVIETYVRGASHEAVLDAAAKVDRSLRAGALALGASLCISNTPGYEAFHPSPALGEPLGLAARAVVSESAIDFHDVSSASDDIGDVACLVPTCQLGFSGFHGMIHSSDFLPAEPERAYLAPAEILLRTVLLLSEESGRMAKRIIGEFKPEFGVDAYLASLNSLFTGFLYSGEGEILGGS
ncbi:MAG: peptidase dimerization domain-containing protein [Spirochaetes bacterium]|nr:peptidase dimerization domain-containing protein [Spirochaetota bacterium]